MPAVEGMRNRRDRAAVIPLRRGCRDPMNSQTHRIRTAAHGNELGF